MLDPGSPPAQVGASRDSVLRLYVNSAAVLEEDDDDGTGNGGDGVVETGLASVIAGRALFATGTHYLRVTESGGNETLDPYRLYAVLSNATHQEAEVEANGTIGSANRIIAFGRRIGVRTATLSPAGDQDVYAFPANVGDRLLLAADGDPERDGITTNVDFSLIAPNGVSVLVTASSSSGGADEGEGLVFNVTTAGTYYVRVFAGAPGNTTGTYHMMVSNCTSTFPCVANADCADGNACTADVCILDGSCHYVGQVCPDDGNPCTTEACDPQSGCGSVNNTNPCTDGNACTTTDTCSGGACVPGPLPSFHTRCSASGIALNDSNSPPTPASPYPSTISVTTGTHVCGARVQLNSLTHYFPDDMDVLLASPAGPNLILMSDVGGLSDITGVNLTLTDTAGAMPDEGPLGSGTFRPTNASGTGTEGWPSPAPAPGAGTALSVFTGTDPRGTWSLFITDDEPQDGGSMGGWCLELASLCSSNADCGDGNPCTDDSCDPQTGCVFVNNTTPCDDGNVCTPGDACAGGACVPGPAPSPVAFCNLNPVVIPSQGAATPYPSAVTVTGMKSYLCSTRLRLNNLSHAYPDDIDMLLSSPAGTPNLIAMSDAGDQFVVSGNFVLDDAAAQALPDTNPMQAGTYRPANHPGNADTFPAPAPAPSAASAFSTFKGINPNGTWNLWVVDDAIDDSGSIGGGWCLEVASVCGVNADCADGDPCTTDVCNPDRTCSNTYSDADGDGVCDGSDCAPGNASAWSIPPEVTGSSFLNHDIWTWNSLAAVSGPGTTYDLIADDLPLLPVGPGGAGEDSVCGHASTAMAVATPPPGGGIWVIVRGHNACGAGSYGNTHTNPGPPLNGPPRVTTTCP
jgi:subtilisin-like proprotein convertase family protein